MMMKRGYTIQELLVVIAMLAIVVALAMEFIQNKQSSYIDALAVTPDGGRVYTAISDDSVLAWDIDTAQRTTVVGASDEAASWTRYTRGSIFSAKGAMLMRWRFDGTPMKDRLDVFDLTTGKRRDLGPVDAASSMAISHDGSLLASPNSHDQIRIIHVLDASSPDMLLGPLDATGSGRYYATGIGFGPDDNELFVAESNGEFQRWDLATGNVKRASTGNTWGGQNLTFSPDGTKFATIQLDPMPVGNPPYFLDLCDTHTLEVLQQAECGYAIRELAFLGDGKSIALLGNDLTIWRTDPLEKIRSVKLDGAWWFRIASAGDRIALADADSVYLVEGNSIRKLGTIARTWVARYAMLLALIGLLIVWRVMRRRRRRKATKPAALDSIGLISPTVS